jgi:hypothetical protein
MTWYESAFLVVMTIAALGSLSFGSGSHQDENLISTKRVSERAWGKHDNKTGHFCVSLFRHDKTQNQLASDISCDIHPAMQEWIFTETFAQQ